jgi:signal transduction histidine kinase
VDVREAILGLTSPIAPERGLPGALEAYASRFAEASKLVTRVSADEEATRLRLAPAAQAQVFRIVQEALTNVRKHAAASRVTVLLEVRDGALVVQVDDDGRGFDPDHPPSEEGWPHYGLRAMRERAASLDARLEIAPGPETGTRLVLSVPLNQTVEVV